MSTTATEQKVKTIAIKTKIECTVAMTSGDICSAGSTTGVEVPGQNRPYVVPRCMAHDDVLRVEEGVEVKGEQVELPFDLANHPLLTLAKKVTSAYGDIDIEVREDRVEEVLEVLKRDPQFVRVRVMGPVSD